MKKLLALIVLTICLTGCDAINNLKYAYYLGHRDKLVCKVTAAADDVLPIDTLIEITNVTSNTPEVMLKGKEVSKYRSIYQQGKVINIQKLDPQTGVSHIIVVQLERGELLYNVVGIESESLVSRTYRAQCK
jgi:hypothetical protein